MLKHASQAQSHALETLQAAELSLAETLSHLKAFTDVADKAAPAQLAFAAADKAMLDEARTAELDKKSGDIPDDPEGTDSVVSRYVDTMVRVEEALEQLQASVEKASTAASSLRGSLEEHGAAACRKAGEEAGSGAFASEDAKYELLCAESANLDEIADTHGYVLGLVSDSSMEADIGAGEAIECVRDEWESNRDCGAEMGRKKGAALGWEAGVRAGRGYVGVEVGRRAGARAGEKAADDAEEVIDKEFEESKFDFDVDIISTARGSAQEGWEDEQKMQAKFPGGGRKWFVELCKVKPLLDYDDISS